MRFLKNTLTSLIVLSIFFTQIVWDFSMTISHQIIWINGFSKSVNTMIDSLLRNLEIPENDLPYYQYGIVSLLELISVQFPMSFS